MTDISAPSLAEGIRRSVIEQSKRANVGHIGSSLSIVEIVAALFSGPLADVSPADADRNRFVLSKGHAVLAFYAALHTCGRLTRAELETFCADGTKVAGHPEHILADVDFSTGSLGHGLSLATGSALAARLQGSDWRVLALLSDAECNEGSVWEAAMFAAHHKLSKLCAVIDCNGQQALGYTRDVLSLEPMSERWNSFGWDVHEVDGHDVAALATALREPQADASRPRVIIARTVFGNGVSFMEERIEWHYLPMSDEEYERALGQVARSLA